VSLALGFITDWRIRVESTAVGLAGGGILILLDEVFSGATALSLAAVGLATLWKGLQAAGHHIAGHPGG
jgi:hypothetical protein